MSRAIVVLAVPRSGSSCVAGALHRMGVDMGRGSLQPADRYNIRGYYEDRRWQRINKGLIGSKYSAKEPKPLTLDQIQAIKDLAKKCSYQPLWGFKDPRTCWTAHELIPIISREGIDVRVIIVDRPLDESSSSLFTHSLTAYHKKNVMTLTQAGKLIYKWAAARDRRIEWFWGKTLRVNYHTLLAQPEKELATIFKFATEGIEGDFPSTLDAQKFVNPGLVHFGKS